MKTPLLTTTALAATLVVSPILAGLPGAAAATGPAYGVTWTVDTAANSISAYPAGASGAATAVVTISGGSTGLSAPSAVQVGSTGTVYVANAGNDSITEYSAGASGDATPRATIAGSATGLDGPSSLALANGELWTTDPSTNVVEAFSTGTSGNELPAETIAGPKTGLDHPVAITVDRSLSGLEGVVLGLLGLPGIYVVNAPTSGGGTVTAYTSGRYGNRAPAITIGSALHSLVSPSAVLAAGFGEVWVASSSGNSVTDYFAFPGAGVIVDHTIAGSTTGLDAPTSLSHDAFGDLVVTSSGSHSVEVFGPHAKGNTAPLRTVTGVGTDSGSPADATVYGATPGRPTALTVVLHRSSISNGSTAALSWQRPIAVGGGLMGYVLLAEDEDGDPLLQLLGGVGDDGQVTTTGTHFTVRHLKLGHRYAFAVEAVNGFGQSGPSNTVTAALPVPASAPRDVRAFSSAHSIAVHWLAPRKNGGDTIQSYRVEYAACVPGTKGCASHSRTVSAHARYVNIGGLKAGRTYDIRVAARTKEGLGALSRVARTTTGS